ncbi:flavohemoglobin expression-modulating QEGLA motif protein [Colwellia sp. D2M02]|uniref:Flavohemoglobin expression-modulating QEGLA motif protein n=1 Tax=Colwellia asteriadis TaxID=517723 RepID=A0ABN1L7D3_9GAMM|nr:flavohemoglobin expression-modulating QEGLA motif protein [Colwellia sp. D2M02]MBU2892347.1 flavohemoglobin expression-modulating QEGLA motif protein [Colwellia sp. D2M02]
MLTLSEQECIALIEQQQCFQAEVEGGAFIIKIDEYSPVICAAVHNGHRLRAELKQSFLLTKAESLYEEDPYTDELISSFPVVLMGNDSRFEYDLSRAKALSTNHKIASKKPVWKKALTAKQRAKSQAKHQAFYNVLEALVASIEKQFKNAIVFDVHAYNYKQLATTAPTFDIGSAQIDMERWGGIVKHFQKQLAKIELPNIACSATVDEVNQGHGYLITHINAHFDNTLVLPIEVKKVFMDEDTGELYSLVLEELRASFKNALSETTAFFMRRYGKRKSVGKADILSSSLSPALISLDKSLYNLSQNVDTLSFINPVNIASERKKFFNQNAQYTPEFTYKQLNINPYEFREKLYKLPINQIADADIQQLYRHVIDNLAAKIDLLTTIGTEDFLYNSLKYYGKPDQQDIANAKFILHAPDISTEVPEKFDADYAVDYFTEIAQEWQLKCRVEKSSRLVAKAMVNNKRSLLSINKEATFTKAELHAYAYHELGIHMHTTINAKKQPLKVFSLGLVGNTHTQEGLAIFSEYCSGSLTLSRLKMLALRVMAVNYMVTQGDFTKTYLTLINEHGMAKEAAFTLTTRVYRGGGFTKDHLYLKGFRDIFLLSKTAKLEDLLVGKTGLLDFAIISEMIERGLIIKPIPLFEFKVKETEESRILDYLVRSIL